MHLRQIETFVQAVELGSLSRAAAALDLSQPSLSRQLAQLEASLGQRLLQRTGRGVLPTEAGRVLLTHARTMLDAAAAARSQIGELQASPAGRVVVGLPPRVALGLGVPLVQGFRQRFPNAVITVLEGLSLALRESLVAGRLDLALLFDPPPAPQMKTEVLLRERLLLVCPPGTPLPSRIGLPALAQQRLILPSAPNAIRALLDRALAPRGIRLQVTAEVGAVGTVLALVRRGEAATVLPESAVRAEAPALPTAPIGPPAIRNQLVLATALARPATRLTRETAQLLRGLDFRDALPADRRR